MKSHIVQAAGLLIAFLFVDAGYTVSAESVQRAYNTECRKRNTGGCTASQRWCYRPPSDKAIKPNSFSVNRTGGWGKNKICYGLEVTRQTGVYLPTLEDTIQLPLEICLRGKSESGSGLSCLGCVAHIECTLSVELIKRP